MAEEKKQVPTKVVGMDSVCAKPEKEIKEPAKTDGCRDWATNPEANASGVNSHTWPLPAREKQIRG